MARSRGINYVINIDDKTKYSKMVFEVLEANAYVMFLRNEKSTVLAKVPGTTAKSIIVDFSKVKR